MTWSQRKYDIPVEDGRTHLERMRAGDWFKYRAGPELAELQMVTKRGCREASALYWDDPEAATLQLGDLLLERASGCGEVTRDVEPDRRLESAGGRGAAQQLEQPRARHGLTHARRGRHPGGERRDHERRAEARVARRRRGRRRTRQWA